VPKFSTVRGLEAYSRKLTTATPADGAGQFVNDLDPVVELYDPSGALAAGDDNSAPDGKNVLLTHTAAATGLYVVKLLGAADTGGEYVLDVTGHTGAPAALAVAKLMYPEKEEPETGSTLKVDVETPDVNVIDAAARGAGEGLHLALNVGAMLLAFIALIALLNALLGWTTGYVGLTGLLETWGVLGPGQEITLELLLGWLLAPLAWIMGVPWQDAVTVGSLMGIKTVVNEFLAFLQLAELLADGALSPRSVIIATYALAGFANFSSIAIQLGGIGGIAPPRRHDLSRLGLRAMIAGTLAAFMTATVAGMLL